MYDIEVFEVGSYVCPICAIPSVSVQALRMRSSSDDNFESSNSEGMLESSATCDSEESDTLPSQS